MHPADDRASELVTALGAVRARIADACAQADRDPRSITLIAVTKTRPAGDVAALAALGVRDVGESKDQEARAKIAELAELADSTGAAVTAALRWHLVGRLQSNKARSVASYATAVHSVDRAKLVRVLGEAAAGELDAHGRGPLEVFVQVSLDGDPDRGGCAVSDVPGLTDAVADHPALRLRGLMAVPPQGSDADAEFSRLAELAGAVHERHPQADAISAGMSDDLEAAVRNGATHLRVGSALLGRRAPLIR